MNGLTNMSSHILHHKDCGQNAGQTGPLVHRQGRAGAREGRGGGGEGEEGGGGAQNKMVVLHATTTRGEHDYHPERKWSGVALGGGEAEATHDDVEHFLTFRGGSWDCTGRRCTPGITSGGRAMGGLLDV